MRGVSCRKLNCDEKKCCGNRDAENCGHLFVEVTVAMQSVAVASVVVPGVVMTTAVGARTRSFAMRKIVHQSDITRMRPQTNTFRVGVVREEAKGSGFSLEPRLKYCLSSSPIVDVCR